MTDVAVLYENLEVVRVPWSERLSLRQDGVLAICVLHDDLPSATRYHEAEGCDTYMLAWGDDDTLLIGWNDDDYVWRNTVTPLDRHSSRSPFTQPANSILFHGIFVDQEQWEKARRLFHDSDGIFF